MNSTHWAIIGITVVISIGLWQHVPIEQLIAVLAPLGAYAVLRERKRIAKKD